MANVYEKLVIGVFSVLFCLMLTTALFPIGDIAGVLTGSDYYEECGCDDVNITAESTNANEIKQHLFDIEQVENPVVRMLVGVPNETEHEYLVVKVEWVTENNRTIRQQREFVDVEHDKVQIVDIERPEKMEYASKMRVEPMGWTNNKWSDKVWNPYTTENSE